MGSSEKIKNSKIITAIQNSKIWTKLKSIKHIEIIIAVIFISVLILIYYSSFATKATSNNISNLSSSDSFEYAEKLESKLERILSSINGAGKVNVMITLEGASQKIIAYDTEEKNNTVTTGSSSTVNTTTTKDVILVSKDGISTPIVIEESIPNIKGVVVVAQGASNIRVKLDMINAVTVLLKIAPNNVQILSAN